MEPHILETNKTLADFLKTSFNSHISKQIEDIEKQCQYTGTYGGRNLPLFGLSWKQLSTEQMKYLTNENIETLVKMLVVIPNGHKEIMTLYKNLPEEKRAHLADRIAIEKEQAKRNYKDIIERKPFYSIDPADPKDRQISVLQTWGKATSADKINTYKNGINNAPGGYKSLLDNEFDQVMDNCNKVLKEIALR